MPDDKDLPRSDETPSAIPDLRGLPLALVLDGGDSALNNAVRRLLRGVSRSSSSPWSAHGSTP
jgi:FXSXX-COOH protein